MSKRPDSRPKPKTIVEALKSDRLPRLRVSGVEKWLVWDGEWVVYARGYRQKATRTLVRTGDEAEAVRYLLEDGL